MIINQPISNELLKQIYKIGISTNEFSTKKKVFFWNYNILRNWNNASSSEALLLVKVKKNILQGFLLATVSSNKIVIENIFIIEKERHKGIASQLITYISNSQKINIELLTQVENKKAISTFILNGFKKVTNIVWFSKRNPKETFDNCLKVLIYKDKVLNNNFMYKSSIELLGEDSNVFVYNMQNCNIQLTIKIFLYPIIKKAILEFISFSHNNLELIEIALSEITIFLFSCKYNVITFHPQEDEKLLIMAAKNINYIEGKVFVYLRKIKQ